MTEIPEHLLARSRARRGEAAAAPAAGGEVEVASSAAAPAQPSAAAGTPATQPATPPAAPPPPPDPPYIKAYKERPKIPFWVMPVLLMLPIWGFIYANTLTTPSTLDPQLAKGAAIYQSAGCAGCHGTSGGGGIGPSFQNGAVLQTWPDFKDHIKWVSIGSEAWPGTTYGAQNKPKGGGIMPAFGSDKATTKLTPLEIALVVRYEREVLAGGKAEPDLVAITEGKAKPIGPDGQPVAAGG